MSNRMLTVIGLKSATRSMTSSVTNSSTGNNLLDLLKTMKVEQTIDQKAYLFEAPRLNIFSQGSPENESTDRLWNALRWEEADKKFCRTPENVFEEQIRWTREGKLWQFPIDNEQGLEERAQEPFHRHIFFNDLMKDLPERGPVRDFMNLVAIGLSKSHTMSPERKRECFVWYKNYFIEHEEILKNVDLAQEETD